MTRFRFTIRELFLLVVIAAICLEWWVDRSRLAARVERMEQLMQSGSFVYHGSGSVGDDFGSLPMP